MPLRYGLRFFILLIIFGFAAKAFAQKAGCSGRVVNEGGAPLKSATILLEPDRHMVQTDENGNFLISQVYEGEYELYVSYAGYKTYTHTLTLIDSQTVHLEISLQKGSDSLEQVTVTAFTANGDPDNLLDIQRAAMPVTVITRETIEQMGSRRLDEILKEQTGVAIVSDISSGSRATGIQMQGFGSEYVMVLIDGQPIVGRNAGNFDLSRISVTNIERIEIIKGASSCLFGSEALGGAVNIITRHGAVQPQGAASFSYGSLNIADATLEGETPFDRQRGSVTLAANYYHSDGFNTDPRYISQGTTSPPYDDYSIQGRIRYRTGRKNTVGLSGRYSLRRSLMEKIFAATDPNTSDISADKQDLADLNLSVSFDHRFTGELRSMSRYYFTSYSSDMSVVWMQHNRTISDEKFRQGLHRFEQQLAYTPTASLKFTGGLGGSLEQMHNSNYIVAADLWNSFAYVQADWRAHQRVELMGGLRYDHHNAYGGKANPSLAVQYLLVPGFSFKLAAGTGFKTPDYRNRYQVFQNPLSNYMVIGTEVLGELLQQLDAAGQISEIRQSVLRQVSGNLQPERSTSFNFSFLFNKNKKLKWETGLFYHQIRNQINSIQVATGSDNRMIFTYQNLPEAVSKGLEASLVWSPASGFEISAGYQYLIAKDLSVPDSIRSGNFPWYKIRDNETGETRDSKPSDYWGIENRSRHMGNLRFLYSWPKAGLNASFRTSYRGKYPFGDANNNGFVDRYDTFVQGFFLLNAFIEKKLLNSRLSIRFTADNIMNYTDRLMPAQPGRVLLLGVHYWFSKSGGRTN